MAANLKTIFLPPLAAPVLVGLYFLAWAGGDPFFAFLFGFIATGIICSGVYFFAFLPLLRVLSKLTRLTAFKTVSLGALCGLGAAFPYAWVSYRASGPDSGPPEGTFAEYLLASATDPLLLAMPVAGLLTAFLYWTLNRRAD